MAEPRANTNGLENQGEFHAKVPRSEPLTTTGHAIGTKVGNDAAPTFEAKTFPAGTAPTDRSFTANPENSGTGSGEQDVAADATTSANDTLHGATSGDVTQSSGHPGKGQSSAQLHSSLRNVIPGKKDGTGLVGLDNVTGAKSDDGTKFSTMEG